jgi:uncharacterized protein YlaI
MGGIDMVKCAICRSDTANYELRITTLYGKREDLILKYLCEDCANELANRIEDLITELKEDYGDEYE